MSAKLQHLVTTSVPQRLDLSITTANQGASDMKPTIPLSATTKRRFLKLADFLVTDKRVKGHFNMRAVCEGLDGGARKLGDCGTVACGMGWAPSIPSIRRAGLMRTKHGLVGMRDGTTSFGTWENWAAFWKIPVQDVKYLFAEMGPDPITYWTISRDHETPRDLAKRIRAYVKASP
jgi:hypothetical protein